MNLVCAGVHLRRVRHECLSVVMGSSLAARMAGTAHANAATMTITSAVVA